MALIGQFQSCTSVGALQFRPTPQKLRIYQQPPFLPVSINFSLSLTAFLRFCSVMPQTSASSAPAAGPRSFTQKATIFAVVFALLTILFKNLDSNLESFYILNPTDLHDLSLRAIGAHGNDTTAVVAFITNELSEKLPGGYINLDEEWIFNNAGGAMGAMYIIHASKDFFRPLELAHQV